MAHTVAAAPAVIAIVTRATTSGWFRNRHRVRMAHTRVADQAWSALWLSNAAYTYSIILAAAGLNRW